MAFTPLPDQAYLCECFLYSPEIGTLTWRARPQSHFTTVVGYRISLRFAGRVTGSPHPVSGYLRTNLNGNLRYNHRIIWKMMTGIDAPMVDHERHDPADNRWEQIRSALHGQNNSNSRLRPDNKCGLKGVQLDPRNGRFRSRIRKDGVTTWLGSFTTAEEAHAAYCKAAQEVHGEFWNPG